MASNFKNSNRRIMESDESSDTESDLPLIQRVQIRKIKLLKNKWKTIDDNSDDTSSSEDSSVSTAKRVKYKDHTKYKRATKISRHSIKKSKLKDEKYKKARNHTVQSSMTCVNDQQKPGTISKSFKEVGTSRHNNTSLSYDSDISDFFSAVERGETRYVIESEDSEDDYSTQTMELVNAKRRKGSLRYGNKCHSTNYRFCMIRIIKNLRHLFCKFESYANRFQTRYLKDDCTENEVGDVMFIFNCVIGKFKDDIDVQQHDLKTYYRNWDKQYKYKNNISNKKNKQNYTKGVPIKDKTHVQDSESEEMFLPIPYKTVPVEIFKISKKGDENKGDKEVQLDTVSKENQSLMQKDNNKNNNSNNKFTIIDHESSLLGKLKEITVLRKTIQNPAKKQEVMKKSEANSTISAPHNKEERGHSSIIDQHLIESSTVTAKNVPPLDYNSDVSSTCSTVALYPRKIYKSPIGTQTVSKEMDISDSSRSTFFDDAVTDINQSWASLFGNSDSDDTIVFSKKRALETSKRRDSNNAPKKTSESKTNKKPSIHEQGSKFLSPGMSKRKTLHRETRTNDSNTKNVANAKLKKKKQSNTNDEKLQMHCQVLMEKLKDN